MKSQAIFVIQHSVSISALSHSIIGINKYLSLYFSHSISLCFFFPRSPKQKGSCDNVCHLRWAPELSDALLQTQRLCCDSWKQTAFIPTRFDLIPCGKLNPDTCFGGKKIRKNKTTSMMLSNCILREAVIWWNIFYSGVSDRSHKTVVIADKFKGEYIWNNMDYACLSYVNEKIIKLIGMV